MSFGCFYCFVLFFKSTYFVENDLEGSSNGTGRSQWEEATGPEATEL